MREKHSIQASIYIRLCGTRDRTGVESDGIAVSLSCIMVIQASRYMRSCLPRMRQRVLLDHPTGRGNRPCEVPRYVADETPTAPVQYNLPAQSESQARLRSFAEKTRTSVDRLHSLFQAEALPGQGLLPTAAILEVETVNRQSRDSMDRMPLQSRLLQQVLHDGPIETGRATFRELTEAASFPGAAFCSHHCYCY